MLSIITRHFPSFRVFWFIFLDLLLQTTRSLLYRITEILNPADVCYYLRGPVINTSTAFLMNEKNLYTGESLEVSDQLRLTRLRNIEQKASRCEQGVFNWAERVRRIIEKTMPDDQILPKEIKVILRRMRTPHQGNFHKLLDQLSDYMIKIHGDVWVKSALNSLGMGDSDEYEFDVRFAHMHDALDNWTLNVLVYFRASAVMMKHKIPHFDSVTRRNRLYNLLKCFRNSECISNSKKALSIYCKFRYQSVVLASNRAGRNNMFIDPTVSVSYTKHRRVAKPISYDGSFNFGDPTSERIREATYVKPYRSFKNKLTSNDQDVVRRKINSWLTSRGLKNKPRCFTYSDQVVVWDNIRNVCESLKCSSVRIHKGKFTRSDIIHPLATFWKRPVGKREWSYWYKWWRSN